MAAPSRRVAWWKGVGRGELIFFLIAVALVAGAILWRSRPGHTVVIVAAFVAAAIAILLIALDMRRVVIEGACPSCGAVACRSFQQAGTRFAVPCGQCLAYVRLDGEGIVEEPLEADASTMTGAPFRLHPKRYLPVAKRAGDRISFDMPKICAVCSAADAPYPREIRPYGIASSSGSGVLGVVGEAASYAMAEGANATSRRRSTLEPTQGEKLDEALSHLTVRVCEQHQRSHHTADPVCCSDGDLCFASYRYYKAFIELNRISAGATESR